MYSLNTRPILLLSAFGKWVGGCRSRQPLVASGFVAHLQPLAPLLLQPDLTILILFRQLGSFPPAAASGSGG